jgi:hypothetical protein
MLLVRRQELGPLLPHQRQHLLRLRLLIRLLLELKLGCLERRSRQGQLKKRKILKLFKWQFAVVPP